MLSHIIDFCNKDLLCRVEIYYFLTFVFNIDDIKNLLTNLELSDLVVSQVWSSIVSKYNEGGDISDLLAEYAKESQKREGHINNVINMFKEEIEKLKHSVPDNTLSDKQKHMIKLEMKEFEDMCFQSSIKKHYFHLST